MENDLAVLKTEDYHSEVFYPVSFLGREGGVSISDEVVLVGFPKGQFEIVRSLVRENFSYNSIEVRNREKPFSGISGGSVFSKEGFLEGIIIKAAIRPSSVQVLAFASVEKLKVLQARPQLSCFTNSCIDEEIEKWYSQAMDGDKRSQFVVGFREYIGAIASEKPVPFMTDKKRERIVSEMYESAAYWFGLAAVQGHAEAQFYFSYMHHHIEQDKKQDLRMTAYWLERAAWQGHVKAQFDLSLLYFNGTGVKRDLKQAIYWMLQAATQGHIEAKYTLGDLYYYGKIEGVKRDLQEGIYWFREAAQWGHIEAQVILGKIYWNGAGVERNLAEAIYWFEEAAKQGHIETQFYLGLIYTTGEGGVKQDLEKGLYWLGEAARQGHTEAQLYLDLINNIRE